MDELLSISEFAWRCGLSVKMLRTYASRGLLVPAAVDASSGYRYYSVGQLHEARVVALLRRAGVPVRDIADLMRSPDPAQLDRWSRQLDVEWTRRKRALADARAALALESQPVAPREPPTKREAMTGELVAGGATHIGGRATNEDALVTGEFLFGVADGLGGLEMGDVASRLALDTLAAALRDRPNADGVVAGGREANDAVWRAASGREAAIGTTLTALAVTEDAGAVVLHVGDSRLYRLREGHLEQLTEDHTVTADLVRTGELRAEDAPEHPHRHVLTRALGVRPSVEIDRASLVLEAGDRLLLCTDGLFQSLAPAALASALGGGDPQSCADALVAGAVGAGASDNVTAVVVDVRSPGC